MKKVSLILFLLISLFAKAQDEKTVTLLVSGQGKTAEEAKQIALRSAIEQAFGAFISSETILINDSFVSENIVSLSQGSITEFHILSTQSFPDNVVFVTLNATVSISQLQKVVENKGHSSTINGGLFGVNLKQLKLQSDAEYQVMKQMAKESLRILKKSINYAVEVVPPKKSDIRIELQKGLNDGSYSDYYETENLLFNDIYKIRMIIECRPNSNYDLFLDYFTSTMEAIKMSESEVGFSKQSGSDLFELKIYGDYYQTIYLRNPSSISILKLMVEMATPALLNYKIMSDLGIINYSPTLKIDSTLSVGDIHSLYMRSFGINRVDSNHYIFLVDCKREIRNMAQTFYFPSDVSSNAYGNYGIGLYKNNSENLNCQYCNEIYYWANSLNYHKVLPIKNNMNVRYQVLDFYLPLKDVEKLNNINILPLD